MASGCGIEERTFAASTSSPSSGNSAVGEELWDSTMPSDVATRIAESFAADGLPTRATTLFAGLMVSVAGATTSVGSCGPTSNSALSLGAGGAGSSAAGATIVFSGASGSGATGLNKAKAINAKTATSNVVKSTRLEFTGPDADGEAGTAS